MQTVIRLSYALVAGLHRNGITPAAPVSDGLSARQARPFCPADLTDQRNTF